MHVRVCCEQDLFGAEGVDVTVGYLKMDPAQLYSGLGHNRLILSAVDCVWWVTHTHTLVLMKSSLAKLIFVFRLAECKIDAFLQLIR